MYCKLWSGENTCKETKQFVEVFLVFERTMDISWQRGLHQTNVTAGTKNWANPFLYFVLYRDSPVYPILSHTLQFTIPSPILSPAFQDTIPADSNFYLAF